MSLTGNANPPAGNAPANEKKGRGRKAGVPAKVRAPLPADIFQIKRPENAKVAADMKRKREERSNDQKQVDGLIYRNNEEWVTAGRPRNWADMAAAECIYIWPVPLSRLDDVLFMIQKALTLYGRGMVWGERREYTENGTKMVDIPFVVVDKKQRAPRQNDGTTNDRGEMTLKGLKEMAEEMGLSVEQVNQLLSK